jgi:hypothetical protein
MRFLLATFPGHEAITDEGGLVSSRRRCLCARHWPRFDWKQAKQSRALVQVRGDFVQNLRELLLSDRTSDREQAYGGFPDVGCLFQTS